MVKRISIVAGLLFSQLPVHGQARVTFKTGLMAPLQTQAKNIFLAGEFDNWNPADTAWQLKPGADGTYQLIKIMPKGNYGFKVAKGSWNAVECAKGGQDLANREINIKNDTTILLNITDWKDNHPVEAKKHTASANVHIISKQFEIPQLSRQRRVWIYLPAGYAASYKKYPVIYMHDGQNLFDEYTSGYGEWGVDEILDKLPLKDQAIVVGIDHGGDYRITEYDPYDSKYGKGRGDDYVDFLVKTLKPYIDKNYRTEKDARHTTIAGSSMGGLISAYAVLKYPDVFSNGGIFSPALWIAPDIYSYAQQKHLPANTRFYFVCGDSESDSMVGDMQKFVDILQAKGVDKKDSPVVIIAGAKHNEKQWNGDFPSFYSWLIAGY